MYTRSTNQEKRCSSICTTKTSIRKPKRWLLHHHTRTTKNVDAIKTHIEITQKRSRVKSKPHKKQDQTSKKFLSSKKLPLQLHPSTDMNPHASPFAKPLKVATKRHLARVRISGKKFADRKAYPDSDKGMKTMNLANEKGLSPSNIASFNN